MLEIDQIMVAEGSTSSHENPVSYESISNTEYDNYPMSTNDVVDTDIVITKESGGWVRKAASKIWNYIKGKADSVYGKKTEAIKNITRSGTTFTATRCDGTTFTFTQQDNNTTYSLSADGANVKLTPSSGSASTASLNDLINGLTTGSSTPVDDDYYISQYVGGGTTTTTYHRRPISKIWDYIKGKIGISSGSSFLRKDGAWATPTNTIPSAICDTDAATAAKVASCTSFKLQAKSYFQLVLNHGNTVQGAITLNINGTGAKPIYINNAASSSENYTLPHGTYIGYYNGTNFYFRTDGVLPASISGNAATATKLGTATVGGTGTPIYLNAGAPTAVTRLDTAKWVTNEAVSSPTHIVGITTSWAKFGYTTIAQLKSALSLNNVTNDAQAKKSEAIKSITRSGTTFTATRCDGTTFTFTQQDNNTTYSITQYNTDAPADLAAFVTATAKGTLFCYFRFKDTNNVFGLGASAWIRGWIEYQNAAGGSNGVCGNGMMYTQENKFYRIFINGTTSYTLTKAEIANYPLAVKEISRNDTILTFTATRYDGTTFTFQQTISSAYCKTAADEAAKTASLIGYSLLSKSYLQVVIVNSNTKAAALTLNINGKGAKPIYINGSASSSSNYTLPAGTYFVYYNGTNYYFRTDGVMTGSITGRAAKLAATQVGSATNPVYISSDGVPTACTHSLNKTVPSDAKFTDTTYSAAPSGGLAVSSNAFSISAGSWQTGVSNTQNATQYRKVGKTVEIDFYTTGWIAGLAWYDYFTLPTGYRPTRDVFGSIVWGASANIPGLILIEASTGKVKLFAGNSAAQVQYGWGNITFCTS